MIYILWGEDQFSMEEALEEIKKSAGDAAMLATNTHVLEAQKLTSERVEVDRRNDALFWQKNG